jgi:hypothetical protein
MVAPTAASSAGLFFEARRLGRALGRSVIAEGA